MLPDSRHITRLSAQLVSLARRGDGRAYDRLFALSADKVLFFIKMRLRPPLSADLDALDVLQETYLEAHRSFERFEYRGAGAFSRWLCSIAAHVLAGFADRAGAKKRFPPGSRRPISQVLESLSESGVNPAELAARREDLQRLEQAMQALDADERQALLLRHFQEETIERMASSLGKSASAVRRLLGRAMAHLGENLERIRR